jgi:hypothetical protein
MRALANGLPPNVPATIEDPVVLEAMLPMLQALNVAK